MALLFVYIYISLFNGCVLIIIRWSALYGAPFGKVSADIMKQAADALNSSGLLDFGYSYVSLDDWYVTGRDANGVLEVDNVTFPLGMADLGEHIHAQGCLYGVYSAASLTTCGNRPASLFLEQTDADTMANDWKIDMLKYDACIGMYVHLLGFDILNFLCIIVMFMCICSISMSL